MRQSSQLSGIGYLSIMLTMLGVIIGVSQTGGWSMRTDRADAHLIFNTSVKSTALRPSG